MDIVGEGRATDAPEVRGGPSMEDASTPPDEIDIFINALLDLIVEYQGG